jgi:3-hydroxymyristoyl/3-hydroxydecanoyl-(acyl carrier protein) dehydratase
VTEPTGILPHRPPFLFIDEVVEVDAEQITALRTFHEDEDFFRGHFPGNPIVPGVLILEAMAQAVAYLAMRENPGAEVFLTGVDRARFRKPVRPGDEIELVVRIEGERMGILRARGEARVGGKRVADAVLNGQLRPPAADDAQAEPVDS